MENVTHSIAPTLEADKTALLSIRDDLNLNITTWNSSSDPCQQKWDYISCNCGDFRAAFPDWQDHCEDESDQEDAHVSRIVFLRMTNSLGNEWFNVTGQLPKAIGDLTALRYLDLESNALTGDIPDSFRNLTELRFLSLAQNQLSGTLPVYFAMYERLKTLKLNSNHFTGPLPEDWCENNDTHGILFGRRHQNETTFTIDNNPICGTPLSLT